MQKNSDLDFKVLFDSVPQACLVLSPELRIVAANNNYLAATMTQKNDIIERYVFEIFPDNPNDSSATGVRQLKASLNRVLETRKADSMAIQKYDIKRPLSLGGAFEERYWSVINTPVFCKRGEISHIIHSVEDMTEFVKLKQMAMGSQTSPKEGEDATTQIEAVRQSQRMEAMGQLAGGVAHDFNNILSVIVMNCEMLLSHELSDSVGRGIRQIKKMSEQAATLTRQLLAFSRKQVLQPRALNLNSIVGDLELMLHRLLNEDIQLESKLASPLGNIAADPGQIQQIIVNLVVNARDAMPNGGKIFIETANTFLDKTNMLGIPKVEPGPYVMLAVRDTGIGMDAKTQARIFEPFFTTKGIGKGTGLGLATVYGIVSQNRGTLWVYSEPQRGTVFKVYFPLETRAVELPPTSSSSLPESLTGKEKILVVEDQADLRDIVCEALGECGYQVVSAENGSQAWELVLKAPDSFDLIITDVVMPEMGGQGLAEKISSLNKKIKIIYLSGYTEDTLVNYGMSGADPHFLEKPFTVKSLLTMVRTVLGS